MSNHSSSGAIEFHSLGTDCGGQFNTQIAHTPISSISWVHSLRLAATGEELQRDLPGGGLVSAGISSTHFLWLPAPKTPCSDSRFEEVPHPARVSSMGFFGCALVNINHFQPSEVTPARPKGCELGGKARA